jgi:ADP-L-glycero-D-manno-heptose 6-epimerase
MPIGVGALTEDFKILLFAPVFMPQLVCSIESSATGDVDLFHRIGQRYALTYLRSMIVITGAAGFIGSALAAHLNALRFMDLVLVDDFSRKDKASNTESLKFAHKVERSAFLEWLDANENQIQFIFHLGARTDTTEQSTAIFDELNVQYSKDIWNRCVKFGLPLVYASSAATYGGGEYGYRDDHALVPRLKPLNPYGVSKNDFDQWALNQKSAPYFWAGLKFFNVFGPNEYHKGRMASVVFHTFNKVRDSGAMHLFRSHRDGVADGHQARDFVYVKDVAKVCSWLMHHRKSSSNGLYNLGSGKARTFLDLARATFRSMGQEENIGFVDTPLDIRDTYQYFTEADLSKLRSIGYDSPFHTLEEAVDDYVKNYLLESRRWGA